MKLLPIPPTPRARAGAVLTLVLGSLLTVASVRAAERAAGAGVPTGGGGRSTSTRYANQASLGQIAGPRLTGGAYRAYSGYPTLAARPGTTPPTPGAPILSALGHQILDEDTPSGLIAFTFFDPDTAPAQLTVTRASSNPTLVRPADLVFGGTGTNRTLRITPRPDQSGSTIITLTISDPQNHVTTQSFLVDVLPVNDPPSIAPIADLTIESGQSQPVAVHLDDLDNVPGDLEVLALSDNPNVIPSANLAWTGMGATRTLTITALPGQTGVARIGVQVTDPDGATAGTAFRVTVVRAAIPNPPRITSFIPTGGNRVRLRVLADSGSILHLESTATLGPGAVWTPESVSATGTGAELELQSDPSPTSRRFYRLRAE